MSKSIQELMYDKLIEYANLNSQGIRFQPGYHIAIYNDSNSIIDDSGNPFNYHLQEVIPVAEEFSAETPFVAKNDRSDYASSYEFAYPIRGDNIVKVTTALNELRDYVFNNKDFELEVSPTEKYTISMKITRPNKRNDLPIENAMLWGVYVVHMYYIATKRGYVSKTTDIWEMAKYGETLQEIIVTEDTIATASNTEPSIKGLKITHFNTASSFTGRLVVVYEDDTLGNLLYDYCMNGADIKQWYTVKETFNGTAYVKNVIITSASRTRQPGGMILIEIGIAEV